MTRSSAAMSSPTRCASRSRACSASARPGSCPAAPMTTPPAAVALRSASADSFVLIEARLRRGARDDRGGAGVLDRSDGAVYLHLGRSYEVLELEPRGAPRAAVAVERRVLHADQAREHDLHRPAARAAGEPRCDAVVRRRSSIRRPSSATSASGCRTSGHRLPVARHADDRVLDPRALVRAR